MRGLRGRIGERIEAGVDRRSYHHRIAVPLETWIGALISGVVLPKVGHATVAPGLGSTQVYVGR